MSRYMNLVWTSLAPMIWGSTYFVTTQWLPSDYPMTTAMLRALPAGVMMLLLLRQLPKQSQWLKVFILGGLNFTVFWICLFISAYRLPGGIAATLGAIQPLVVIVLGYIFFNGVLNTRILFSAMMGVIGVTCLVVTPDAQLNSVGVVAAIIGAASMALGTLLSQQWRGDIPLLTFTTWQLTSGGLLLLPLSLFFEPPLPTLTVSHMAAFFWLSIAGALLSYSLWFRGISVLGSVSVSVLGFLSPLTAILIGWMALDQHLGLLQMVGVVIIFTSIIVINKRKQPCIH